jgi:hypothetical protein
MSLQCRLVLQLRTYCCDAADDASGQTRKCAAKTITSVLAQMQTAVCPEGETEPRRQTSTVKLAAITSPSVT